jgi:hypothetical protein
MSNYEIIDAVFKQAVEYRTAQLVAPEYTDATRTSSARAFALGYTFQAIAWYLSDEGKDYLLANIETLKAEMAEMGVNA